MFSNVVSSTAVIVVRATNFAILNHLCSVPIILLYLHGDRTSQESMDDAHREFVLNRKRLYYGWPLVGVGFLVYGLGIAPAYYSWGFFGPELVRDVGLTRQQVGSIFGAFTLTFAVVSPLAAAAMGRFGLRAVVTAGALISAFGFWMVARAESATDLYWSFALVGGLGIGDDHLGDRLGLVGDILPVVNT